eukprot:scaffold15341_cov64-Phaeocystis_antarctica.AAC.6
MKTIAAPASPLGTRGCVRQQAMVWHADRVARRRSDAGETTETVDKYLLEGGPKILLFGHLVAAERVPLPIGHRQQRPPRRAQLPPLERRRPGGHAAAEVIGAIDLDCHLAPAMQDHGVEATWLSKRVGARWSAAANAHAVLASSCGLKSRSRGTAAAAIASSSAGAAWLAVANAHAVLASCCGLKSRSRSTAAAAIASSSAGARLPAVANAHAVLASSCAVKLRSRGSAAAAIASSSAGAAWLAVANAHAVLARFCGVKSRSRGSAAAAIASSSAGARWSAVANAHAVLERSCGLKSRSRGAAAAAIASSSAPVSTSNPTNLHLARPCAMFDSSLAPQASISSTVRRSSSRTSSW